MKHRSTSPKNSKGNSSHTISSSRRWVFRFASMILSPLLILGLLEAILRIVGYGYSTALFKPMEIGGIRYLVENEKFSYRFFPPELARTPGPIKMLAEKPSGTYRIFILGESAAMGDPEPGYGAARYLESLLRERYPDTKFEFINVAFTAINSHVILPIAQDCAKQQSDLWLIYMGNNEMVGPFGGATVFGPKAPPLILIRLNLALQELRLGQLVADLRHHLKRKGAGPASWGGMQMFLGNQVPPDSSRRASVYQSFQSNLRGILEAGRKSGAHLLVNTVAVNLKDCPPFASYSATNLSIETEAKFESAMTKAEALEKEGAFPLASAAYDEVLKIHPMSAEAHYRYALCLLQLTNSSEAAKHFQSACDLDTLPFRTDSRENDIIRKTCADFAGPWLSFFDANAWIAQQADSGIPGKEAFYEHVHFNFDGNYRLALGWANEVARLLPPPLTNHAAAGWASQDACEKRLGLTDWNRAIVIEGVVRRMQQPPLSGQENNQLRVQGLNAKVNELRSRMSPENAQQARDLYLEAIKRSPDDYCLHENFASFLVSVGDIAGATTEWERVHQMLPQDYLSAFRLGELLSQQGKLPEAEVELIHATQLRPYLHEPYVELGKLRIAQGRFEQALKEFELARHLRPADAETEYHSGRALALLNRREEAIEKFRLALKLNPNSWQAHDALGGYLGLAGNIGDARAEYEQVVRLQPRYARGHLNLGVALLKQGEPKKAAEEFQEALRLEPTNAVAAEYLQQANKAR